MTDQDHQHQPHHSGFMAFLKQLSTFTGDLSQLTAPSFLLNGTSLLEYSAHWLDYPQMLGQMASADSPLERMICAVRWFISTLPGSFYERCAKGSEKKPYNPILGEVFYCSWQQQDSSDDGVEWKEANMIVEQVSHHPPVTAFHAEMPSLNADLTGHYMQKSHFKGTYIKVDQLGRLVVNLKKFNETYFVGYPEIHIRGILTSKIFLELGGTVPITSSSGYRAEIQFLPKPWFSGDYHYIKGSIYDAEHKEVCQIKGRWMEKVEVIRLAGGQTSNLFDPEASHRPVKIVKGIDQQGPMESRKVWHKVTEALAVADFSTASKEKTEIEEAQRALRKQRAKSGETWKAKHFESRTPLLTENSSFIPKSKDPYWEFSK